MFEKILERVLDSYFGKYISGLDKNIHLSVLKGNVKIENVSFKQEIMDLLELPFEILYSNIGQLIMNVSWTKLSSTPVTISLENIYVIVGLKKQANWNFVDKSAIEKKLENIDEYAKQCLDKLIQKKSGEEKGTLEKMTVKIIDNIQLQFKNIHIRLEDTSNKYSFGLTLQEIKANTTDENWQSTFIDRTKPEEANKPINKLLQISNLSLYWNQNETVFLQNLQKYDVFKIMQGLIDKPQENKNVEVIIKINAEFKLINSQPQNFKLPLYQLAIELEKIDLHLKHQQLQQISDLVNLTINYRDRIWAERKKVDEINEEMKENYKKHFLKIYYNKLLNKQQGNKDQLETSQQQIFDNILKSIDYPMLYTWVRSVVLQLGRENKVNEIKNSSKGFFSKKSNVQITEDQVKEIEDAINNQLEQAKTNAIQRPDESIHFNTSFTLKGGSILLTKDNLKRKTVEGIKLTYSELIVKANTFEDDGQDISFSLQQISMDLQIQQFGSQNPQQIKFLYRDESQKQLGDISKIIKLKYKKHSIKKKKESKENFDGSIVCYIEPIKCIYNYKFIEYFKDFFDIKSQHEYFSEKKQKLEQITALQKQLDSKNIFTQKPQDSSSKTQSTPKNLDSQNKQGGVVSEDEVLKFSFDITVERQTIIIPFSDSQHDTPCWKFAIERVNFKSSDKNRDIYQVFNLELKNMSFYYLRQSSLIEQIHELKSSDLHKVIDRYNFHMTILHQQKNHLDIDKPQLQFEGSLDPLFIDLNEELLRKIIKIQDLISPSYYNIQEKLRQKKEDLEKNSKLNCSALYRQKRYQRQVKVQFIIDSTDRVHLFYKENSQGVTDLQPFLSLHLNNLIDYTVIQSDNIRISFQKQSSAQKDKVSDYEEFKQNESRQINTLDKKQISIQDINPNMDNEVHFNSKLFYIAFNNSQDLLILQEETEKVYQTQKQQYERHSENLNLNLNINLNNEEEEIAPIKNEQMTKQGSNFQEMNEQVENISNLIHLQFKSLMIKVSRNESPYIDFNLQNVSLHKLTSSYHSSTSIQFQDLKIEDYVFKYNHSVLQPIFSTVLNQGNEQFFKVAINENFKNDEMDVQADLMNCILNWKPDSLLALRHLYVTIFQNDEEYQMKKQEEVVQKNINKLLKEILNDQSFNQLRSMFENLNMIPDQGNEDFKSILVDYDQSLLKKFCSSSLLNVKLRIQDVQVHFIQHQTHAPLIKLKLLNSNLSIKATKEATFIQGTLGELEVSDLTNYPQTVNANSESEIKEYVIIKKKDLNQRDNVVKFKWSAFDSLVNKEHFDSFLDIQFSPISIIYQQQPIMRIIDYLNNQILALISYPDEIIQSPQNIQTSHQPKNVFGQIDLIIKDCLCPKFLSIRAELQNPELILKAKPSEEGFLLSFSNVQIENSFNTTSQRYRQEERPQTQLQDIWVGQFNINVESCQLKMQDQNSVRDISLPVKMNLIWEQLKFDNEIKYIWPTLNGHINNENQLRGNVSSFFLRLNQQEYMNFIKMVLHNFTYDDGKESEFIYNYEHVSVLEPNPINLVIDFQGLTLVKTEETSQDPDTILSIQQSRIKWLKDSQQNIMLNILSQDMVMSLFKKTENEFIRKDVIGKFIGQHKKYSFVGDDNKQIGVGYNIIQDYQLEQQIDWSKYNEKAVKFNFMQEIQNKNGDEDISFIIQDIKILLQTDKFLNLIEWCNPKPECYPSYKQQDEESRMVFIFKANNVICAFPIHFNQQVIAARGQFSFIQIRQRMQKPEIIRTKLINQIINSSDLGDLYTYNISFHDFEIFSCNFKQLVEGNFSQVHKRNLLDPLTAEIKCRYEAYLGPYPEQILYFRAKNMGIIQKVKIKCSFKNLNLLHKTIQQQQLLLEYHEKFKQKMNQPTQIQQQKLAQQNQVKDNQIDEIPLVQPKRRKSISIEFNPEENIKPAVDPTAIIPIDSIFEIDMDELQIHLVNDTEQCSIPVLQFKLVENKIIINQINDKKNFSISLCLQLCYYNPSSSFWEPIIEKNYFLVDFFYNPTENPKRYLQIQQSSNEDSLNINISQKMLEIFKQSIQTWKKQFQQFIDITNEQHKEQEEENLNTMQTQNESKIYKSGSIQLDYSQTNTGYTQLSDKSQQKENIEYISPFSIQNKTGYSIYLENENQESYVIENNSTINYQINEQQSQEYNQINSKKINIQILSDKHTFHPIQNVHLGYLKTSKVSISSTDQLIQKATLVLENSVQTNRKLLKIHSILSFQNLTDKVLEINMFPQSDKPNDNIQMSISQQQIQYAPFDRLDNSIQFKFSDLVKLFILLFLLSTTSFQSFNNFQDSIKKNKQLKYQFNS